jgi:hypothetical protein
MSGYNSHIEDCFRILAKEEQMSDWVDNEAFWDVLRAANKLLSRAGTEDELLGIERALCFEIRCIAAAVYEKTTNSC